MTTACTMIVSLVAVSELGCGSKDGGGGCDTLTNYQSSTSTQLSLATDIMPILTDATNTYGCGTAVACHGNPSTPLDTIDLSDPNAKHLQFVFNPPDPAMVKAQLLQASVNAPGMMRVVPSNVGASFMAYKLSKDRSGLACVSSMCVAGASIGVNMPCGDLMPSLGTAMFPEASRTKILDWIAQGAKD
jgi:hypothetical protein